MGSPEIVVVINESFLREYELERTKAVLKAIDEFTKYNEKFASDYRNASEEEKKADTQFYVRGGYLKTYTYKDAWSNFWKDTDEENRKKFLALPNFDADVFLDITGIDVRKQTLNLKGKEVKVALDGVEYVAVIK